MGLSNPIQIMFVLAIALMVLGPKRLPEVARAVGHSVKEFRGSLSGANDPATDAELVLETVPAPANTIEA